jgi:hypothetical protein
MSRAQDVLDHIDWVEWKLSDPRTYITGVGQFLGNTHIESMDCHEHGCVIHNPTTHSMSEFPTLWRADRGLMERVCPHGVGHPDPDHMAWYERTYGKEAAATESIHGCDGCCMTTKQRRRLGLSPAGSSGQQ